MLFGKKKQRLAQQLRELETQVEVLSRELEQRTRREEASRRHSQQSSAVLDALFTFVAIIRPDGVVMEANRRALCAGSLVEEDVFGELLWESYWWSYSPDVQSRVRDACRRAARGETVRGDILARLGDETFTTLDCQMAPLFDEQGDIIALVASAVDVSARVQVEHDLRLSRERFKTALLHSPVVVFNQDRQLRYTWIHNPATGYGANGVLGKSDDELLPAELASPLRALKRGVLETGIQRREDVQTLVDGEVRTYDLTVAPLRDEVGGIVGVTCASVDVTDERRMVERLHAALSQADKDRRRLRAVIEAMSTGVIIAEADGRLLMTNQAADRIWHGEVPLAANIVEYEAYKGWWPDTGEALAPEDWGLARALQKGETTLGEEIDIERFDGTRGTILNAAAPVRDAAGQVIGGVVTFMDITERKALEQERDELLAQAQGARLEAERAVDLRNRFTAMIAHDLRSPLTSILGFASTLLAEDVKWDENSQRDFIRTIQEESQKLNGLIEDLLEFSRAEAGQLRLEQESTSLVTVLAQANAQLAALAQAHELEFDVPAELLPILADERRVARVLTNLVSNAAKYSPEGTRIAVRAGRSDGALQVDVVDEGEGIPSEAREYVFEPFRQVEGRRATRQGTGLGLAICRAIVQAHGGHIWVQDRPGPGTTVSFTLPLAEPAEQ